MNNIIMPPKPALAKLNWENISITKAENGWIVDNRSFDNRNDNFIATQKSFVFESTAALAEFINERF